MSVLERLAGDLRAEGGLLAAELDRDGAGGGGRPATATAVGAGDPRAGRSGSGARAAGPAELRPGAIAAAGPRAAGCPAEYDLLVEAIYEGYRQHYGVPRLMRAAEADFSLLAGDRLYASGLERLVGLGDVTAVVELADVISLCALVHIRGEGELAGPVWTAGARAVGWGASPDYVRAKALLMAGDARGPAALRAATRAPRRPPAELGR